MIGIVEIVATYAIEKSLDIVIPKLYEFATQVSQEENSPHQDLAASLPSVCLVGLGRCGSNIAVGVSSMVFAAKQKAEDPTTNEEGLGMPVERQKQQLSYFHKIISNFQDKPGNKGGLFLIEPIVIVGDLDKDTKSRIKSTNLPSSLGHYKRLVVLDLEEVHGGGAGNVPIIGQYIGAMALSRQPEKVDSKAWQLHHNYIIDSAGVAKNPSRLFFFVFSAGGGSGSGMAGEFGSAQQLAFRRRIRNADSSSIGEKSDKTEKKGTKNIFEQVYSLGVAILPHGTSDGNLQGQAVQINAGRLIVRYLAEQRRSQQKDALTKSLRPFNSMILISNDIMKFALISRDQAKVPSDIDTSAMEKLANQYVSQQIFNVLTAQAPITDYSSSFFASAGIDVGDSIKLDSNDLSISLSGPVVVAYSEASNTSTSKRDSTINTKELLQRAVGLPRINNETGAIEGLSVLPEDPDYYRDRFAGVSPINWAEFGADIPLFSKSPGVVAIVSLPAGVKLPYQDLADLKTSLRELFPNAKLIRYALVLGASPHIGLTVLISQSAVVCDEVFKLATNFIARCMCCESEESSGMEIVGKIIEYLSSPGSNISSLNEILSDFEDPTPVMNENWETQKIIHEGKFKEVVPHNFVSIDSVRVTKGDVIDAVTYIKETAYYQRVSLTIPSISRMKFG
ncbi:hypothetical protein [Methylobacterium sp. Leaf113]|uniref:hypothetical protein n=1 Tax=Methylobacterium sp. Leaf113 TaxID=1736259 RepID=UPI000B25A337|nr:hypothetical protein [Methylobacterium sp. Leaf113]